MMIDTHSHLHTADFDADRMEVFHRAQEADVQRIVLIAENIADARHALELAQHQPECLVVAGLHPHKANEWSTAAAYELTLLLREPQVVGVGETGIDYHYDFAPRDKQWEAFRDQVTIAREAGKPLVVHCREAYQPVLDLLNGEFCSTAGHVNGVMHCYFGTLEQAREFVSLGFMLGIGGAITFKKAEDLHRVVEEIPLSNLVLETDAPYMAPTPNRGKRNEPAYLTLVVHRIAEIKGVSEEQVCAETSQNAARLFQMASDWKNYTG